MVQPHDATLCISFAQCTNRQSPTRGTFKGRSSGKRKKRVCGTARLAYLEHVGSWDMSCHTEHVCKLGSLTRDLSPLCVSSFACPYSVGAHFPYLVPAVVYLDAVNASAHTTSMRLYREPELQPVQKDAPDDAQRPCLPIAPPMAFITMRFDFCRSRTASMTRKPRHYTSSSLSCRSGARVTARSTSPGSRMESPTLYFFSVNQWSTMKLTLALAHESYQEKAQCLRRGFRQGGSPAACLWKRH